MGYIFVSHSHQDKSFATILARRLCSKGFKSWTDASLLPGTEWRTGIDKAIVEADALIVVVSSHAKKSEYVTYEWAYALGAKINVVPILLNGTRLHPKLAALQYLDFSTRRPYDKLAKALKQLGVRPEASPISSPPPRTTRSPRMSPPPPPQGRPSPPSSSSYGKGSGRSVAPPPPPRNGQEGSPLRPPPPPPPRNRQRP